MGSLFCLKFIKGNLVPTKTKSTSASANDTPKPDSKPTALVDISLPLPDDKKHLTSDGNLYLLFNSSVIELSSHITTALQMSRNLPADPNAITFLDPVTLLFIDKYPELTGTQCRRQAIHYYETEERQCTDHAMIIALTDNNELKKEATPYEPGDLAYRNTSTKWQEKVPSWRAKEEEYIVPPPDRNMSNRYERRLKQLLDLLADAGIVFMAEFFENVNNNIATMLREGGVDTDKDGFHVSGTGS